MRKALLYLAFLGWAGGALGQAPAWVLRNTAGTPQSAPAKRAWQTATINATTAWQLMGNDGSLFATHVAHTTNGTTWTYLPITGTPGFSAGSISAIDANTAYVSQYNTATDSGGEVLKTTNGGVTWTKVTTTQFTSPGSYLNWVHFFDALTGVAFGDPIAGNFEVYRTADGGATWQRVAPANLPAARAGEGGALLSYCAQGNTVWAGTGLYVLPNARPVRIYKSADRGLTWTASALTPLLYGVQGMAFQDQNNGIAYNTPFYNSVSMIKTTDGGTTWFSITPAPTARGRFRTTAIDAIPGAFLSVGATLDNTSIPETDRGSSVSADGITWRDIDGGPTAAAYVTIDALSPTVAFAGAYTAGPAAPQPGSGGMYQLTGNLLVPLPARHAAQPAQVSAYPNPSADGVFEVALGPDAASGAHLRARDVLGREVFYQRVSAAAAAAQRSTVDLSRASPGVYTVELRTATTLTQYRVAIK